MFSSRVLSLHARGCSVGLVESCRMTRKSEEWLLLTWKLDLVGKTIPTGARIRENSSMSRILLSKFVSITAVYNAQSLSTDGRVDSQPCWDSLGLRKMCHGYQIPLYTRDGYKSIYLILCNWYIHVIQETVTSFKYQVYFCNNLLACLE